MKKVIRSFFCALLCMFVFFCVAGAIHPEWKLVSKINGNVESLRSREKEWIRIHQTRLLKDGDMARTLENSRAKIQLADQSVVTIGASTTVEVSKFQLKENARIVEIKLMVGKVRAKVAKHLKGESRFELRTNESVLAARGTEFYVEVQKKKEITKRESRDYIVGGASEEQVAENTPAGQNQTGGGEDVYLCVFDGIVEARTRIQSHTFYPGERALITSAGVIIANPDSLPPSFNVGPGETQDLDLKEQPPSTQVYAEPPQPPVGCSQPGIGPPPPMIIQPATVNTGTTGTIDVQVHW